MVYALQCPFWQTVDQWQTLIAGVLALIAAVGTIWATNKAANREIVAAKEQTKVAQEQIRVTLLLERQRNASTLFAFSATLEASMTSVLEDVKEAREIFGESNQINGSSLNAYKARQCLRKTAFADLRGACLRLGGPLTEPFIRLEREIDHLAGEVTELPSALDQNIRMSPNAGTTEGLNRIEAQAIWLRTATEEGKKRCKEVLDEPPIS